MLADLPPSVEYLLIASIFLSVIAVLMVIAWRTDRRNGR